MAEVSPNTSPLLWDGNRQWTGQLAYGEQMHMEQVSAHDETLRRIVLESMHPHDWDPEKYQRLVEIPGMQGYLLHREPDSRRLRWEQSRLAHMYWEAGGKANGRSEVDWRLAQEELNAGRAIAGVLTHQNEYGSVNVHALGVHPDIYHEQQ